GRPSQEWRASESHEAIRAASVPSRRTFGVTATGRRLPARFRQPELRKQAMSMTRKFSLGLLGAFVAVMLTSQQAAAQTAQQGEARDAAIRRCIAEAHRQYPEPSGGQSQDMQRADVYKACMVAAGFQP